MAWRSVAGRREEPVAGMGGRQPAWYRQLGRRPGGISGESSTGALGSSCRRAAGQGGQASYSTAFG